MSRLIFAIVAVCLSLPALGQQAQQQDNVKELSKDLGELNSLVQQLRVAEQPAQDGKQMAYLRLDSEAKAQPMVAAKNTAQFKHGEAAQVLKERGDWVLVVGQDNKTGWVESQAIAVQATAQAAFDMAVEKIIRQLQKMRAKYSQGPVVLSGFTIDVKFPPGASVEFGFK